MAKNKRKALSAIQNNVIASPRRKKNKTGARKRTAASSVTSPSGSKTEKAVPIARPKRISSKARASDIFEGNKNRVQYVKILKDVSNTLYKSMIDEETNGVYFYPINSQTTPVAFDKTRHILVYRDEEIDNSPIETAEVAADPKHHLSSSSSCKSSSDDDDDDSFRDSRSKRKTKAKPGATAAKKTAAVRNSNRNRTLKTVKIAETTVAGKQKKSAKSCIVLSDNDRDELDDESSSQSMDYKASSNSRSRFDSNKENFPTDWRSMNAIDY